VLFVSPRVACARGAAAAASDFSARGSGSLDLSHALVDTSANASAAAGRITFVGSNAGVAAHVGKTTRVVELTGNS
jgi:hypothetical protein